MFSVPSGKLPKDKPSTGPEELPEQQQWQLQYLLKTLKDSGHQESEDILQAHHTEFHQLVQDITDKVKAEATVELNTVLEAQIKCLSEEYQRKTEELQCLFNQEKQSMTDNFQAVKASLQDKVDVLTAELQDYDKLKQRVKESTFKRDLQNNIQAHSSPGAFWEQELESLLFVIEMKSERLQEQGRKLMQLEALVEKNFPLEDQVKHLLQQNEDLHVRLENYQCLIQQLSKEKESLHESLEKEVLLSQKLNQEKDELLYKLLHPGASPSHLPPLTPELSPG
ncbi:hypothetical protein MATL_G00044620 [Megalops atlanticus]|uniref:Coiled-coil domain containing 69 n=1 Tax=Megalops atlanticus TaxID=7932 RepID=A0A9D3TEJ1_MEGAT|nr:hypothetical protein MATL_G00044620 [Megalops atlanticus]